MKKNQDQDHKPLNVLERRKFISMGGLSLLGVSALGNGKAFGGDFFAPDQTGSAQSGQSEALPYENLPEINRSDVTIVRRGTKPVYLPPPGSKDPVMLSFTENLFWLDIMMEHSMFFVMLMPGEELKGPRQEALQFQKEFHKHLKQIHSMNFDSSNYRSVNQTSITLTKNLYNFKLRMRDLHATGKLRSLVWPSFFEHTADEAARFIHRLTTYSHGVVEFDKAEVLKFWAETMGEHAKFIAHLLDPKEEALIERAFATGESFHSLTEDLDLDHHDRAAEEIVDFKAAAEKGIREGTIKSIIPPSLADHVLREAVKYSDEIKRV